MKIEILVNPKSGRGRGPRRAGLIAAELANRGYASQISTGICLADTLRWAKEKAKTADRLVVLGGDGTLNAVLQTLPSAPPPIVFIPLGTANVLARELKLPRTIAKMVDLIEQGEVLQLDTGVLQVHGESMRESPKQRSFMGWGFGLDGELMRLMDAHRSGGTVKMSEYVPLFLQLVRDWRPTPQRVWVDGKDMGVFEYGVVYGIRNYGGQALKLGPATYDDGLWEVYLFPKINLATGSALALAAATRQLTKAPGVVSLTAKAVRNEPLSGEDGSPVQVDGEYVGTTPVEFALDGKSLPLLVPDKLIP